MRITYTTKTSAQFVWLSTLLVTSRLGEELVFNDSDFYSCKERDHQGTFDELNSYIAACMTDERKDQLFACYKQARLVLDTEQQSIKSLLPKLQVVVRDIYDLVPLPDLYTYLYQNRLILIPDEIPSIIPETKEYAIATTYIKPEYGRLVGLSVGLHLLAPIIPDYVNRVADLTGRHFKEHAALALLDYASIMTSPEMLKLKGFVSGNCSKKPVPLAATLEGLSEDTFPDWMLASVIARRLCIMHVRRSGDSGHLVAGIFSFVQQAIRLEYKFGGNVVAKGDRVTVGEDEREKGVLDNWKMKQDIDETDILACMVGFDDLFRAAQTIEPGLPFALLQSCLNTIPEGWELDLRPHQVFLLQWVVGEVLPSLALPGICPLGNTFVPPLTVEYFSYETVVKLVALVQAVLWHRGSLELAAMVGTYPGNEYRGTSGPIDQLDLKTVAELEKLYGGIRLDKRQENADGLIYRTVDQFKLSVITGSYKVMAPDALLRDSQVVDADRYLLPPQSLCYLVASYIRYVATR